MLVKLLKSLLPRKVKDFILVVLDAMSTFALKIFSSHPLLANIYYLFSQKFAREHQAVLKGRLAFRYQQGLQGSSHTLLRRNICLLYTSPSPRDMRRSRMPSSA